MNNAGVISPLNRSEGVTDAERYLTRLARQSFLSLWSYPGIYRDQGEVVRGGDGKEVCDLLVVFDEHVLIFSDKECEFPDSDSLDLDWSRWFRRAIAKSVQQVRTSERWIRLYPDRLFLDRKCQQPFPIDMPPVDKMRIHRIVVAHGASERCKKELGGSGSLMIMPHILDDAHLKTQHQGGVPFAVGQVCTDLGYCHIFDDTTLDIVLNSLDTTSDFVTYLSKKERFIIGGELNSAAGEEEILAFYLKTYDKHNEHNFTMPSGADFVVIGEGSWDEFEKSPQRKAQLKADEVS